MRSIPPAPWRCGRASFNQRLLYMGLQGNGVLILLRQLLGLFLVTFLYVQPMLSQNLLKAEELFRRTDFEGSLALLDLHSEDPVTNFLIGRDYFLSGDFKKSVDYFQKATVSAPTSSEYMDWLGRAYGKRAETSNLLSAPGWASKARQAFERAVQLDSKNSDALSDLFDFYLEAPGFMGGGYDKAEAIAERLAIIDPSEGFYVKAKLAQQRKQFNAAEQHLRQAVAIAPRQVGHLITLARFLANQGRIKESDAVFEQATQSNPNAPQLWFARADTFIKQKRNFDQAKLLLSRYVSAPLTVDDPPKEEARRLLRQVGGA